METKYLGYRFSAVKITAVVFGFGSQAFVCGFSRQNICSAGIPDTYVGSLYTVGTEGSSSHEWRKLHSRTSGWEITQMWLVLFSKS